MRAWSPIYEGDSIIHHGGALSLPNAEHKASEPAARSPFALIGDLFRGLLRWLEQGAERARYRELENYLAGSGDVFELERRIRKVERGYGANFDSYF